ncbi:hypothetical protein K2Z83_20595 [Oscillochloris sp. ZM17-4]|uniref:hypothetical protein n=1 Tax=Oscillochloris sp. ZM17-4 TaxID=2866714 RepID=UPI001C737D44|nr:hypothetical protein [Oscillochloris sp. ZM17-4]MBX0330071.1 hypothetical protein [Oscillochloris sp. ZM17-4]
MRDLLDELLANSASRLVLRTEEPDASVYARKYAAFELTAADISAQPARQHAYAVAMQPATGAPVAFSIIPQPWPAPVPADDMIALRNPAWWEVALPPDPDPHHHQADVLLARQIYRPLEPARYTQIVGQLARLPDDLWALLHDRWERIRAAQRAAALTRIGYVPNRLERQAVASRLETRACGLLADAAYQRQRWARDPQAPLVAPTRTASPPPRVAPARTALIPGLAPDDPGRPALAPPAAGPSAEELLRQRGRRRADADIAAGFAFGPSPHVPPPATPDAPTPTTDTEDS